MENASTKEETPGSTRAVARQGQSRRQFVKRVLAAGAAASLPLLPTRSSGQTIPVSVGTDGKAEARRQAAYNIRVQAATQEAQRPLPDHTNNGDEERYPNRIASFTKGMPHNNLGEVDPAAYQTYLTALATGKPADFEAIPLGCPDPNNRYRFVDPQGGLAFDLEGLDAAAGFEPPAPAFGSPEENGEIIELYWMALTRDIPFTDYDTNPLTQQAAADLSRLGDAFKGPKANGQVTAGTLFRDVFPGCLVGPYVSQFRWLDVPFGANYVEQRIRTAVPNVDFMTNYQDWLTVQMGCVPSQSQQLDSTRRFIHTGRDAAAFTRLDILQQAYYIAMLILLAPPANDPETGGLGGPYDGADPYHQSANQVGFATFGSPHIATLLPEVGTRALHAQWFQKWFVHRRLRPEEYGGRIHNTLTGAAQYPVDANGLSQSPVLNLIHDTFGSYLLPQAFPEGAPLHPSYGSGHATVAGACVTILKAFFDESYVIPNPVVTAPDGLSLVPYTGADAGQLTVGGELNKLASNMAQARNIAGVHWRSDAVEAMKLGEAVAISILQDQRRTYNEPFNGFSFTKLDGTLVTV